MNRKDADEKAKRFAHQVGLTAAERHEMQVRAQLRAHDASVMVSAHLVGDVIKAIDKHQKSGVAFRDFQKQLAEHIREKYLGGREAGPLGRRGKAFASVVDATPVVENLVQTNLQTIYAVGRELQMRRPENLAQRPYAKFIAILDTATSAICRSCNGTCLPITHPWWFGHTPPLHFSCRSTKVSLTESEAEGHGVAPRGPTARPMEGFGNPLATWVPDLSGLPPDLRVLVKHKLKERR